jgi:hypothetical protein
VCLCRYERQAGLPGTAKSRKVMTGVERPYPDSRTSPQKLHSRALAVGCAIGLAFIYVGTCQLQLRAEPAAASSTCKLEQKRPLFVGFAKGSGLDSFEPTALASRGVYRTVKQWLCNAQERPAARTGHTPSLLVALTDQRLLRAEQIQFDDAPLQRAHLVLAELSLGQPRERGWHVHVARGPEGWSVSHVSDQRLAAKAAPPSPGAASRPFP